MLLGLRGNQRALVFQPAEAEQLVARLEHPSIAGGGDDHALAGHCQDWMSCSNMPGF
ncbi:MAG: hypothetical protein ACI9VR_002444 [Cognaticolwellia sp.]|jgi:hypothetical protein